MASYVDISIISPNKSLRIIPFQKFSGAQNMALDLLLAESIKPEDSPILRFYGWKPHCISLGFHQEDSLVSRNKILKGGIHLVRRPTGGSAILHANELTYSLIVPNAQGVHHEVYSIFHKLLSVSLVELGYAVELHQNGLDENYLKNARKSFACFNRSAFAEIKYNNKKVVGSAQKILRNGILQHGSIILSGTQADVLDYLTLNPEELSSLKNELRHSSISLEQINSQEMSQGMLSKAITEQFAINGIKSIYFMKTMENVLKEAQKKMAEFNVY